MINTNNFPGPSWTFISDHLPIAVTVNDSNVPCLSTVKIASWNVLNSLWINYLGSQGLLGSRITQLNIKDEGKKLTQRDLEIMDKVQILFQNQSIVGLQEVHSDVIEEIEKRNINGRFELLKTDSKFNDKGVIIFNKDLFDLIKHEPIHGIYSDDTDNYVQHAILRNKQSGHIYQIINTHIPGGKEAIGKTELATHLSKNINEKAEIIFLMGDMNQTQEAMQKALKEGLKFEFTAVKLDYKSHINTLKKAVSFDHIFIYSRLVNTLFMGQKPIEVLGEDLQQVAKFLEKPELI